MTSAPPLRRLSAADRRAGAAARRLAGRRPRLAGAARVTAALMSPGFRIAAGALALHPATRRAGVRALVAAVAAALAARALRDRIGRRRPGPRAEGGFPSRHAAASAAIACAVAPLHPRGGAILAVAAAAGMGARVVTGDHEPGDIAGGAALGVAVAAAVASAEGAARRVTAFPR